MDERDQRASFREMRDMISDDVDEIVRWQMTGMLMKKAPVHRRQSQPRCMNCGDDWHGLPQNGCRGSHPEEFDTPNSVTDKNITTNGLG